MVTLVDSSAYIREVVILCARLYSIFQEEAWASAISEVTLEGLELLRCKGRPLSNGGDGPSILDYQ